MCQIYHLNLDWTVKDVYFLIESDTQYSDVTCELHVLGTKSYSILLSVVCFWFKYLVVIYV